MAGVHSCGMGRVGDGLVTAVWVTGAEPAHSAVASYSLQLRHTMPYGATMVSPALYWQTTQDNGDVLYSFILLFL